MHSLDCMNLSTSASDARSWSLCSSGLFTVKSFFTALSQMPDSSPFFPTKFVWKSQVPFKVKAFIWLVAHKKLAKMDWVPPKSISDMMFINYKGFGKSKRGTDFIKDILDSGQVCTLYVSTKQLADGLTKGLSNSTFHQSLNKLGMQNIFVST
ncbi:hypothetical protein CK203_054877 [Vitis vinifera]|uniref:Reverse transcriptase zinc-binding domain-containing protein n=1 Tax=Vitis vinifera TaxID=29760 RepID=A0A438GAW6_VITVI|nr:hypothetical protein CK203_054877 [Vitis vinifera]